MILARKLTCDAYRKNNSVSLMDCLVAFSISGHYSRDCPGCLIKTQVRHQASTRNVPSRSLYPLNLAQSRHLFQHQGAMPGELGTAVLHSGTRLAFRDTPFAFPALQIQSRHVAQQ